MLTIQKPPNIRLLAVLLWTVASLQLGTCQELERNLKAAFLYNFTKYVTWPAGTFSSSSSPIVIGVMGQDEIDSALDAVVSDKTVDGRKIVVRHYRWNQDLTTCQVLFIPASESANATQLSQLRNRPVLTVGESPGFAKNFGVVNFVVVSNRVRFEINEKIAKGCGLTLSSKLLSLGLAPQ